MFENRTYGGSRSSGKSLAWLPVKTCHESLLAPEKLKLKVRTFKNISTVYEFVQFKAWERKKRLQKAVVILLLNKTNLPVFYLKC